MFWGSLLTIWMRSITMSLIHFEVVQEKKSLKQIWQSVNIY